MPEKKTTTSQSLDKLIQLQNTQLQIAAEIEAIRNDAKDDLSKEANKLIRKIADNLDYSDIQAVRLVMHSVGLNVHDLSDTVPTPKPKRARLTDDQKKEIVNKLKSSTMSAADIATAFGVSSATVNKIKKEAGLTKSKK